jgi:sugar phosphate isomerase/epimerase
MTHTSRNNSRRDFFKMAGVAAAGLYGMPLGTRTLHAAYSEKQRKRPLKLALASYTTRKFDLDQTLEIAKRAGLDAVCLKSFHLPLEATTAEIKAAAEKVKKAGVTLYGCGVVTLRNEQQVNQAFDYAKAAGMIRIMAAPSPGMLPLINKKVQQYDIEICIHNHGPGDDIFPTPDKAYEAIKELDRRIGICHDVGHTVRYGADPVAMTQKCADRIYDVHIKDVTSADKAGESAPCGRGVMDLPPLVRTFAKIGFPGYLAFEYESEADDPLPGLAESVGYIRGVMDTM